MFEVSYRVYHEDMDDQGIMYNSNFLKFAERARSDWLRELGFNQSELEYIFVVRKIEIDFLAPARLDDIIQVKTHVENFRNSSFTMRQEMFVDGQNISNLNVLIVCVDKTMKPMQIPQAIKDKLQG